MFSRGNFLACKFVLREERQYVPNLERDARTLTGLIGQVAVMQIQRQRFFANYLFTGVGSGLYRH